jgi:hypothetical protein
LSFVFPFYFHYQPIFFNSYPFSLPLQLLFFPFFLILFIILLPLQLLLILPLLLCIRSLHLLFLSSPLHYLLLLFLKHSSQDNCGLRTWKSGFLFHYASCQ